MLVRATEAAHSMAPGPALKGRSLRERVGLNTTVTSDIGPIGPLGSNLRGGTVTWFQAAQAGFTVHDVRPRWTWVYPVAAGLVTLGLVAGVVWLAA